MLDDVMIYVASEMRVYLGLTNQDIFAGHIEELRKDPTKQGAYLSLINLEEEHTLKNTSHVVRQNNQVQYKQPPVFLNLYMVFAFRFQDYGTSLLHLGSTVELFQTKPVLSAATAAPGLVFPASVEKLVFDLFNLDLERLNYLWAMMGGGYLPSVVYKVRLVKVQADVTLAGPEITTIQVNTSTS